MTNKSVRKSVRSFRRKIYNAKDTHSEELFEGLEEQFLTDLKQLIPSVEEIEEILDEHSFDIGGCGVGVNVEEATKAIHSELKKIFEGEVE